MTGVIFRNLRFFDSSDVPFYGIPATVFVAVEEYAI